MNAIRTRTATACAALLFSGAALAQYAPDATMDLGTGYGQIALGQSILDGTRAIDKDRQAGPQVPVGQAGHPSRAQMQAMWKQLEPEYLRRVQADGKASADAWLAATARELGRRDGQAARQR
jgi:hypothetical protein